MKYSLEKLGQHYWRLLQHVNGFKRVCCDLTTGDIEMMYESVFPEYSEEVFVEGNPNCIHQWIPYKLNDKFKLCHKCDAVLKCIRLVPRRS